MTSQGNTKIVSLPAWIPATWRERGLCQCCGSPAFGTWAGTGELLCETCTQGRQAACDDRFRD